MDFDLLPPGAKEYFQGKYVEAVAEWDKLIASDPNNVTLLWYQLFLFFIKVTVILNDHSLPISNRAAAYFEMEMYRKCETECDKIIKKDPNYLQAYILKGWKNKKQKFE